MGIEEWREAETWCFNILAIWEYSKDNILMPILRRSNISISLSNIDSTLSDKEKDEDSYEPVLET